MLNIYTASNDQLDAALARQIEHAKLHGLDTTEELEALFAERSRRIRRAERAAAAYDWTTDPEFAEAPKADRIVRVKTTPAQSAIIGDYIECLGDDAALVKHRVTYIECPASLAFDLGRLVEEMAEAAADCYSGDAETPEQIEFAQRQIEKCHRNAARKLRDAARKAGR